MRIPSHQPASEGRSTGYRSWTADRHPLKNAVSEQGPYGRAGTSVSCRPRDQATALRQASPVRRLMISKPLPFVCTAGVSARRGHLLQDRHNSRRFAGRYQIASWLPRHIPKFIKCRHIEPRISHIEERGLAWPVRAERMSMSTWVSSARVAVGE